MQSGYDWEPNASWNEWQDVSNSSLETKANWQGRIIIFNSPWPTPNKLPKNLSRFVRTSGLQDSWSTVSYELDDEQIELVEKSLTSVSSWSTLANRGVFSPNYDRKVHSKKELSIDSTEIPRWKPHIFIDIRRLELDDE